MPELKSPDYTVPPEPKDYKDLGYTVDVLITIEKCLEECGNVFRVFSPSRNNYTYVVNDPEYAKHILINNHRNYIKGLGLDRVKVLTGNGLIVSDGDFWKQQRQMIQPAFHRKVMAGFTDLILDSNRELVLKWQQKQDSAELIDLYEEMSTVTLKIVLSALFSEDLQYFIDGPGENPFTLLTQETERNLLFAQRFRSLGKKMMEIINKRRKEGRTCYDFVGMMMEARNKTTGLPMKDPQLLDEIRTLIIAGHETTALTLTWAWHLLSQNPEVAQKLYDETVEVLGHRDPEFADLEKLKYMECVIDETLRLYPPAWLVPRRSLEDDEVGPYFIPAGSDVFISPYFLQRDPAVWEQPKDFKPERFSAANSEKRNKLSYIPFSAGPRKCIGDYFSILEMKFHLAMLIRTFKLLSVDSKPIELEPQVNLRNKYPIYMKVVAR